MIIHGGEDGQLSKYGMPNDYVFEHTSKQLRQLNIGENEIMPTLAEVLELMQQAPGMLINVEIKAPSETPAILAQYDYKTACAIVKEHIDHYQVQERTIISSFCPLVTRQMKEIAPVRNFQILQLLNYGGLETDGYSTPTGMQGVNLDLHYLDQDVIENIQTAGKLVAVWYWTKTESENTKAYDLLFGKTGNKVDYFYSD